MRTFDFGFHEYDCLLIHGSTLGVDDVTPDTPPLLRCDRLSRGDANILFCGRSGLAFQYQLQTGSVNTAVTTLDRQQPPQAVTMQPRQVIGLGNIGSQPGIATYTLYNPNTNHVQFKTIQSAAKKGFQT